MPQAVTPLVGETLRQRITAPGEGWSRGDPGGFALPPEPDPATEPVLHALWGAMLADPLQLVPPDLDDADEDRVDTLRPRIHAAGNGSGLGRGHVMQSRNWSGLLVTPGDPDRLRAIGGEWIVPVVQPGAEQPLDGEWRCSTWVGLDGHFSFALSLPQLGTDCRIGATGPQQDGAWFQWWVPGTNTRPHYVRNLAVEAGARIGCYLWKSAADEVGMLFRRLDAPAAPVVALRLRGPMLADGKRAPVFGTTAEWVVERPTKLHDTALYPLPLFKPIAISLASAGARGPVAADGAQDGLTGGRLIRMYAAKALGSDGDATIQEAVRLANATRDGGNGVLVTRV